MSALFFENAYFLTDLALGTVVAELHRAGGKVAESGLFLAALRPKERGHN